MSITEIFKNPLVKQVIFQIRFPNLFYLENKIGDFQTKIMKEFPESHLLYRKQVTFADIGPGAKIEELLAGINKDIDETAPKIWQFISTNKVKLSVTNNSLDIVSDFHRTYNQGDDFKFRDIIKFVLDYFFEIISIPIINRIGLRYINECPIPGINEKDFSSYYNSIFPFKKFKLEDTDSFDFRAVIKKESCNLIYIESIKKINDENKYILDFDCFSENLSSKDYLKVADKLHDMINESFEQSIKEPVKDFMRK